MVFFVMHACRKHWIPFKILPCRITCRCKTAVSQYKIAGKAIFSIFMLKLGSQKNVQSQFISASLAPS